jgi:hypothetical protein
MFSSSTASRPTLEVTQLPVQWVLGSISPGVKRQRREADHLSEPIAEVKSGGAVPALPHKSYLYDSLTLLSLAYDVQGNSL